jgi:hypothetical protein
VNDTANAPKLPSCVLRELADCGNVPANEREFFFESIRTSVATARELDRLKNGLAPKRGASLARSALTLYDTLGNLSERERTLIEGILRRDESIFDRISTDGVAGLIELAYQLALLSSLVTGRPRPRFSSQLPDSPSAGRKSGTVKNWMFQNFVRDLVDATSVAGGKLTLEKNIGVGSLFKAIDILKPYLPDNFVPTKRLSASTLQRIKDASARTERDIHGLDEDSPDGIS